MTSAPRFQSRQRFLYGGHVEALHPFSARSVDHAPPPAGAWHAAQVRATLDDAATLYDADEVLLVNIMHDHGTRLRSYALMAEEYGLAQREQAA